MSGNASVIARLRPALAERYRIESELGGGGMAVVLLAQDVRHARPVAVKVLQPELSAIVGADRFLNEIRITARLQHPHILPLIDSGEAGGLLYYIMPFVEGESLRARITRERQLPIADALRIAADVADALDYAHRHGVIHRDIKPENILLHDGRPAVADFGIALAVRNAGGQRLTESGLSIGTPAYMSPEQAAGDREIDGRSDIYSLGCVLYEMLAGEPPHSAPNVQALINRILVEKPRSVTALREALAPGVQVTLDRALAKLPADRFASAGDLARALRDDAAELADERRIPRTGRAPREPRFTRAMIAAAAAGMLAVGVGTGLAIGSRTAIRSPPSRLSLLTHGDAGAPLGLGRTIAITPDGANVVYLTRYANEGLALNVQPLHSAVPAVARTISAAGALERGSSHVHVPPDGSRIVYSLGDGLAQMPLGGGSPTPEVGAVAGAHLAWQRDGSTWYTHPASGALHWSAAPEPGVPAFEADSGHELRIQQVLRDGRMAMAVVAPRGQRSGRLVAFDLRSGERREILTVPVVEGRYVAGHLVYATADHALHAIAFDARTQRVRGAAAQLADDLSVGISGVARFAVAANGTIAYVADMKAEIVFADRSGATRPGLDLRRDYHAPRFAPDGRLVALTLSLPEGRDIWVLDVQQRTLTRATFDRDARDPIWSTDGRTLTYLSARGGVLGIHSIAPGSPVAPDPLFASPSLRALGAWDTRTGDLIAAVTNAGSIDIVRLRNGGRGPVEPIVATPFDEAWPAVSKDGHWLAYTSTKSGERQVYVRPLASDGPDVLVSPDGGWEPVWSGSGRVLYYRRPQGGGSEMIAATVSTAPSFRVVRREVLFSMSDYVPAEPHANFDVAPGDTTFVLVRRSAVGRLVVIQNFSALLRHSRVERR